MSFNYYVSKPNFVILFKIFLQEEVPFIKWEQNHRWPDGTYIKNDYTNIVIL